MRLTKHLNLPTTRGFSALKLRQSQIDQDGDQHEYNIFEETWHYLI